MTLQLSQNFTGVYLDPLIDNLLTLLMRDLPALISDAELTAFDYYGTTHRVDELGTPRLSLLAGDSVFADVADYDALQVTHTLAVVLDVTAEDPDVGRRDLTRRVQIVDSYLRKLTEEQCLANVTAAVGEFQLRINRHSYGQFPRASSKQRYLLRCELEVYCRYLTA